MAVGDSVGGISAINTTLTFQPASGVEIMISGYGGDNTTAQIGFTSTVGSSELLSLSLVGTQLTCVINNGNIKLFITNTFYIRITPAAGSRTSYTGIQIK